MQESTYVLKSKAQWSSPHRVQIHVPCCMLLCTYNLHTLSQLHTCVKVHIHAEIIRNHDIDKSFSGWKLVDKMVHISTTVHAMAKLLTSKRINTGLLIVTCLRIAQFWQKHRALILFFPKSCNFWDIQQSIVSNNLHWTTQTALSLLRTLDCPLVATYTRLPSRCYVH